MPKNHQVEISIVTPAHNEAGNIEKFTTRILQTIASNKLDAEIILINDVSQDKTGQIMDRLADKYSVIRVVHRQRDNGPGNAERAGFAVARGKWIVTLDSDLSHRPEEIPEFIRKTKQGFDMVIGSRFIPGGDMDGPAFRLFLSRTCAVIAKVITGYPLHDASSGFRIMKATALKALNLYSPWFEIHTEIPIKFFLHGYKVGEIPIRYERRGEGQSKLTIFQSVPRYVGIMIKERLKHTLGLGEYSK